MFKFITKLTVIFTLVLFSQMSYGQTSWTGTKNTNWNSAANWTNGVPSSTIDAIIGDGNFVGPNDPTVNVSSSCRSLTVGGSVSSVLSLKKNLVVNGSLLINANGTISHPGSTLTVKGDWVNNGSYNSTSSSAKLVFGGAAQLIKGANITTFRQVTINTGTVVTLGINTSISGSGSYIYVYGTLSPGESPTYKLTSTVNFRVYNNGKIKVNADVFANNYALSGSVSLNAGSIVDYSSTTVNQVVSSTYTYSTLMISGTGVKSLSANLPALVSSASTTGVVFINSGTFDLGSFTANRGTSVAGGELNISNGAVLKVGGASNFPTGFTTRSLSLASTVDYYVGNQAISAETYGNLTLSGNSGSATKTMPGSAFVIEGNFSTLLSGGSSLTSTANSDITINGSVTIGTGTTFNGNTNNLTVRGNWINSGTFAGGTGTVNFDAPSLSISGAGSQNFNNLNILRSGITASGNLNVSGNFATSGSGVFTHTAGAVLSMTGSGKTISGTDINLYDLTITGTVTNTSFINLASNLSVTGTLTCSSGIMVMSGASKTISGAGTKLFSTLQVTGTVSTAVNFSVSALLDISGTFSASAGSATFTGSSMLSGTANLFNTVINGTSLTLTSSSVLGIAGSFTITTGTLNVTANLPNTVVYNGAGAQTVTATTYHHLTLSNGNTKTAAGNITVNGGFTLGSATTFAAGSYTHTILRNWINNGTFSSTGVVQFTGSNNATITGATTFSTLTINKTNSTNTVSLLNDVSAATVNMTNGTILTDVNKITITTTRTGNGIILGTITRTHMFMTAVAYAFEGPSNTITFNSISGVTSVTVYVKIGTVSDFPDNASINREYSISVTGASYMATLRLHYEDAELNGNSESFLELWKNNSSWVTAGKSSNSTTTNYVELTGISNLNARWTLLQVPGVVRWTGAVSSNWENAANWSSVSGGGSTPPSATDIVQIGTGSFTYDPSISSSVTVKGISFGSVKAASLNVTSGGSLTTTGNIGGTWTADAVHTINVGSQNVTVNGNLNLGNAVSNRVINLYIGSGNLVVAGSLLQNGNAQINFTGSGNLKIGDNYNYVSGSFIPGPGTVTYEGSNNQAVAAIPYNSLVINKPAGIATLNTSLSLTDNLTIASGTLDANNVTLTVPGNVLISSGAVLDCDGVNFNVGGNWTNNGTYIFTSGLVLLNGTGMQTVSTGAFNNLTISKASGTVALAGNNNISGNLSLLSGTLNLSAYTINRVSTGGSFTQAAGTSLLVGGANNFPGNFSTNTLNATSNVLYNGTIAQSIKNVVYGHLSFSNGTTNAKTLAGNTTISGDLLINTGATFSSGGFTTMLTGNWTNNGSFSASTGSVVLNGSSKTITGNTSFYRVTVNGSYAVAGSDIVYNGALTINESGSFAAGSGTATVSGNLTNSGSLTSTGTTNFTGTTVQTIRLLNALVSNSTGVINFNGNIAPVLNSTSSPQFVNVNINNTAGINPSVNWTIYGAMTVGAGASFNGGISTHTLYGSFTNNGTVTSTGRLRFLPTTGKTIAFGATRFSSNGMIELGGTGQITLTGNPVNLKTVVISNSNAAGVSAPSSWLIDSNFVVASTSRFNAGSYTFTVGGNIESDGILNGETSTFVTTGPTAELTVSTETVFHHLVNNGMLTPQTDYRVDGDFNNNGTYDGSIGTLIMTGAAAGSIGGTTAPLSIAQLTIEKTGNAIVTQNVNLSDVLFLNIFNGILFTSTKTITQDPGGGFLFINSNATLRLGGTNSLPGFAAYGLDVNSTVDYAGVSTAQLIGNAADYGHLLISGTGSKNAYAALTVLGNLTVTNGTLNTNTVTVSHSIAGNFIMTGGTLSGTNSTYILNGDSNQVLSLLSPLIRLRINKYTGLVNLNSDVTVNLSLTFNSGKIATGNYRVIIPSSGTVAGAGQFTGWVIGNLQKNVATGTSVSRLYEIGGDLNYAPATVLFASVSAAGNVTGKTWRMIIPKPGGQ